MHRYILFTVVFSILMTAISAIASEGDSLISYCEEKSASINDTAPDISIHGPRNAVPNPNVGTSPEEISSYIYHHPNMKCWGK